MTAEGRFAGRYAIYGEIAAGGMATVHFARLFGTAGFSRTVAIKRLHAQLAKDPEFVAMFLDEAHVAARVRHPNVVPTLDVVSVDGEIFIVMEYVHGESLWRLLGIRGDAPGRPLPPRIAAAIVANVLHGLHAAHEATNEAGEPLGIVHRDVSPQNVLVGKDGVARVLDFGIVKARDRIHVTRGGLLKGKVSYMAPEQLAGRADRRTDVYAAGVVLWEALTGKKLFVGDGDFATADKVKAGVVEPPSKLVAELPAALDAIVLRAVAKSPGDRFATADEMAMALERDVGIATPSEVGAWVASLAREVLEARARTLAEIETSAPRWSPEGPSRADPDPDGLAPTRAIDVSPQGEATEVSLSSAVGSAPAGGARWKIVASGAALALAAGAGAVALWHRAPVVAAAPIAPGSIAPVVSSAPIAPLVTSAPPAMVLPPVVDVAPSETASVKPAAHHAAPRSPCSPPYVVDARGIRHLKPECLR